MNITLAVTIFCTCFLLFIIFMNKILNFLINKYRTPRKWRPISPKLAKILNKVRHKICVVIIEGKGKSSFIEGSIGDFTENKVHAIIAVCKSELTLDELAMFDKKFRKSWKRYYKTLENYDMAEYIILGDAREYGLELCDMSEYNTREIYIWPIDIKNMKKIGLMQFVSKKLGSYYDFLGVLFHLVSRKVQSNRSYYCSEIVYDAFKHIDYRIAKNDKPKPNEIYNYLNTIREPIIYKGK